MTAVVNIKNRNPDYHRHVLDSEQVGFSSHYHIGILLLPLFPVEH